MSEESTDRRERGVALTPLQMQTAMMSAMGLGPTEIARTLGCAKQTIIDYAKKDWWVAERDKWVELGLAKLDTAIHAQRARMLALHDEMVTTLFEAVTASDADGHPLWQTRMKAAEIIARSPAIMKMLGEVTRDGPDTNVNAVTVVNLHIPEGRRPRVVGEVIDQEPLALEIEESGDVE